MRRFCFLFFCMLFLQLMAMAEKINVLNDDFFIKRNANAIEGLNAQFENLQNNFISNIGEEILWVGISDYGIIRQNIYVVVTSDNAYIFKNKSIVNDMDLGDFAKILLTPKLKELSDKIIQNLNSGKMKNSGIIYDSPLILLKWRNASSAFSEKAFYFNPSQNELLGDIFAFVGECENIGTFGFFKLLREENPSANIAFSPALVNMGLRFICENSCGAVKQEVEPFVSPARLPKKEWIFDFSLTANYNKSLTLVDGIKKCGFSLSPADFGFSNDVLRLVLKSKFEGKWQKDFDKVFTSKGIFGSKEFGYYEVDFMKRNDEEAKYAETDSFEVVSLPFKDCDYEMFFFKPKQGKGLADFDASNYKSAIERTRYASRNVKLSIPKFKIKSDLDFIPTLKKLGINRLFEYTNDYKLFKEEISIACEKFRSETEVAIDEKGAIAISQVVVTIAVLSSENTSGPIEFKLDKPFVYAIYNRKTSQILYIGQIVTFENKIKKSDNNNLKTMLTEYLDEQAKK